MDKQERKEVDDISRRILVGVLMHAFIAKHGIPTHPASTADSLKEVADAVIRATPIG